MDNKLNSSGKFPRIHYIADPRRDSKDDDWMNQSVIQCNSKEGLSSCQCTMTLIGQNEEIKKFLFGMLSKLLSMLEDSREDIGRFQGLDPRKNGTELLYANPTGNGTKLLRIWCSTLPKADILVFRATERLGKRRIEKQRKRKEVHSLQRQWWNHWIDSSNSYFRQSAQCPRSSSRLVWRMSQRLIKCRETRRKWEFGINGNTDSISFPTANTISQTDADVQGNLLREYEQKCAELPEQQKLTILCANAGIPKNNWQRTIVHYTWWRRTWWNEPRSDDTSHMRGWIRGNTKIGPSLGCEGLLSSRTLRCGNHDRIFISWQNCFLGSYRRGNEKSFTQTIP